MLLDWIGIILSIVRRHKKGSYPYRCCLRLAVELSSSSSVAAGDEEDWASWWVAAVSVSMWGKVLQAAAAAAAVCRLRIPLAALV